MKAEPAPTKPNWTQWMSEAQQGNTDTYRLLLSEIQIYVMRSMKTKFRHRQDLEDYTQEVLLGVHRARASYDHSRKFEFWLHAIMKYKFSDFLRKRERLDRILFSSEQLEQVAAPHTENVQEPVALSEKIFSVLKTREAQIIRLLKMDGLSIKETAKQMKMSEVAVKVSAHRSYKKLKKHLESHLIED